MALIPYDWCPYRKRRLGHRQTQRDNRVGTHAKERGFRRKQPSRHRDLRFQPLGLGEDRYLLLTAGSAVLRYGCPGKPIRCLRGWDVATSISDDVPEVKARTVSQQTLEREQPHGYSRPLAWFLPTFLFTSFFIPIVSQDYF